MIDNSELLYPYVLSLEEIREGLVRLNALYGKGSIDKVDQDYSRPGDAVVEGEFTRRIYISQYSYLLERRKFRVLGRTLYALRHQVTVKEVS